MTVTADEGGLPDIKRNVPTAIHAQISEHIRLRIAGGEWPPHYRLKSEPELAQEFGVSRGTVRRALATLIEEGLLRQVRGRGTFVTSTVIELKPSPRSSAPCRRTSPARAWSPPPECARAP
ncbi:GntR family transcriptional regulator [Streptomyces radiopugnans]|nr:GntR family transcriptional regulator [Streptomyces radiopugnans]